MRILLLLFNPFTHDSRVLRQARSLAEDGHEVHVFATHQRGLPYEEEAQGFAIHRFRLWSNHIGIHSLIVTLIKGLEVMVRMVVAGISLKPNAIQANDLDTLPIGYLLSRLTSSRLVYDSHELWRDCSIRVHFPDWFYRWLHMVEAFLASRCDAVLTVSAAIARDMEQHLRISRPRVVRNIPLSPSGSAAPSVRDALGVPEAVPILVHSGALVADRGVLQIFEAFAQITTQAHLVFLGSGPEAETLLFQINESGLSGRVHLLPPVNPDEVSNTLAGADIGLCTIPRGFLSYEYCLPNKLFEYLQAGLALIVSDLPEMSRFVREKKVGVTYFPGNLASLIQAMRLLLEDVGLRNRFSRQSQELRQEVCWEQESRGYLSIYQSFDQGAE